MMQLTRRTMLAQSGGCLGAAVAATCSTASAKAISPNASDAEPFGYCLNTGTLLGFKLSVVEEVDVAAKAGYQGIELWTRNLARYVEEGGSLADLRKRIADSGLTVESAIGFARWIVDDDAQRAAGLEQLKREMDQLAQIGGLRIAAPPAGANREPLTDLAKIAERYRTLLELGSRMGIVPQLETWGSSRTLSRLGDAIHVAVEAQHPDACLLLDAYHLYKGGNDFQSLRLLNGAAMHVFHINDYPADPPRETITDADRVYPGDGVCPLGELLDTLDATGFRGMLSLELFNRTYWEQDPMTVARTGLEKTRAVVRGRV